MKTNGLSLVEIIHAMSAEYVDTGAPVVVYSGPDYAAHVVMEIVSRSGPGGTSWTIIETDPLYMGELEKGIAKNARSARSHMRGSGHRVTLHLDGGWNCVDCVSFSGAVAPADMPAFGQMRAYSELHSKLASHPLVLDKDNNHVCCKFATRNI